MKFFLTLIQLTIASPRMASRDTSALEQVIDQTMMNIDVIMAAFANYEEQLISNQIRTKSVIHSTSNQKKFNRHSPKNFNQRVGRRCFWKIC